MFSAYLRILAHVPRWVVLPVIHRQSVAEHSFFVAHYVAELLDHPRYKNKHSEWKFEAMRYAVVHDRAEARMGDFPGPIKRRMKDPGKLAALETEVDRSMGAPVYVDDDIRDLIKAADTIEEYFYLTGESQLGSRVVKLLIYEADDRMVTALNTLGCGELAVRVRNQASQFFEGLQTLTNNDDVAKARGGYVAD